MKEHDVVSRFEAKAHLLGSKSWFKHIFLLYDDALTVGEECLAVVSDVGGVNLIKQRQ